MMDNDNPPLPDGAVGWGEAVCDEAQPVHAEPAKDTQSSESSEPASAVPQASLWEQKCKRLQEHGHRFFTAFRGKTRNWTGKAQARMASWKKPPESAQWPHNPTAIPDRFRLLPPEKKIWGDAQCDEEAAVKASGAPSARLIRVDYAGRHRIAEPLLTLLASLLCAGMAGALFLLYFHASRPPDYWPDFLPFYTLINALPWPAIGLSAVAGLWLYRLPASLACSTTFYIEAGCLRIRNRVLGISATRTWRAGELRTVQVIPLRRFGRVVGWIIGLESLGGGLYSPLFKGRLMAVGLLESRPAVIQYGEAVWLARQVATTFDLPVYLDDGASARDFSARPILLFPSKLSLDSAKEDWSIFTRKAMAGHPVSSKSVVLPPNDPRMASFYNRYAPSGARAFDSQCLGIRFDGPLTTAFDIGLLVIMALLLAYVLFSGLADWNIGLPLWSPTPGRVAALLLAGAIFLWAKWCEFRRTRLHAGSLWALLSPERLALAKQRGLDRASCERLEMERDAVAGIWLYSVEDKATQEIHWHVMLRLSNGRRISLMAFADNGFYWKKYDEARWFAQTVAEWSGTPLELFEPGDGKPFPRDIDLLDPATRAYRRASRTLRASGFATAPDAAILEQTIGDRTGKIIAGIAIPCITALPGLAQLVSFIYSGTRGNIAVSDIFGLILFVLIGAVLGVLLLRSELIFQAGRGWLVLDRNKLSILPSQAVVIYTGMRKPKIIDKSELRFIYLREPKQDSAPTPQSDSFDIPDYMDYRPREANSPSTSNSRRLRIVLMLADGGTFEVSIAGADEGLAHHETALWLAREIAAWAGCPAVAEMNSEQSP